MYALANMNLTTLFTPKPEGWLWLVHEVPLGYVPTRTAERGSQPKVALAHEGSARVRLLHAGAEDCSLPTVPRATGSSLPQTGASRPPAGSILGYLQEV